MENVEFTDEEIREQLANLGYHDVSQGRLQQFRKDLQRLVERDRSSMSSSFYTGLSSPSLQSDTSPVNQPSYQRRSPQRSPPLKPSLSRFQPHIPASPRNTHPKIPVYEDSMPVTTASYPTPESQLRKLALGDSSHDVRRKFSPNRQNFELSDATKTELSHLTPETQMQNFNDSPPEVARKYSPNRRMFDYSETQSAESSSDNPMASHHGNDTDDVIPRILNKDDETTPSLRHHYDITGLSGRFQSNPSPETPSTNDESSEQQNQGKRIIRKRKVMRKQGNGESAIFDESLVTDGDTSYRMHDVSMDDMSVNYDRVHLPPTLPPRPHTARPTARKPQDLESIQEQPLPSYIRPNTSHPHTRNLRKTDPVNRYHQYRDAWNSIKAPGERSHSALRWEVKAQMMYKDEPQLRAQRVYVPNTYVVPTSKKRAALRWEVRHALERGLPVPSAFTVM